MNYKRISGMLILLVIIQMSSYAIEPELGEDLIENAIAQKQICAEGFFNHLASFITSYMGSFTHKGDYYVFLKGDYNTVRDSYFRADSGVGSSHYLDTGFNIKPYVLIKMSEKDVNYLFSSINSDSELFDISSAIRSEREFVDHVDRVIISLTSNKDNVQIARYQLSKYLEPSGFVENIVTDTLKKMRIQDFEVFTYTVASLVVTHRDQKKLSEWNTFLEKKLQILE